MTSAGRVRGATRRIDPTCAGVFPISPKEHDGTFVACRAACKRDFAKAFESAK